MSKYNNFTSIPVESIPKEEIEVAMKEWAEGSEGLYRLLKSCYLKNVKTNGCHAGNTGKHFELEPGKAFPPYLEFIYDMSKKEELIKLINATFLTGDCDLSINICPTNPYAGKNWINKKVSLDIAENNNTPQGCENYFDRLSTALVSEKEIEGINPVDPTNYELINGIFEISNYLIEKNIFLDIRLVKDEKNGVKFSFENLCTRYYDEALENFFVKIGLKGEDVASHHRKWSCNTTGLEELSEKIKEIQEKIKMIEFPSSKIIEDKMDTIEKNININFNYLAFLKMRQLGDTAEGRKKFAMWLLSERLMNELEGKLFEKKIGGKNVKKRSKILYDLDLQKRYEILCKKFEGTEILEHLRKRFKEFGYKLPEDARDLYDD